MGHKQGIVFVKQTYINRVCVFLVYICLLPYYIYLYIYTAKCYFSLFSFKIYNLIQHTRWFHFIQDNKQEIHGHMPHKEHIK